MTVAIEMTIPLYLALHFVKLQPYLFSAFSYLDSDEIPSLFLINLRFFS